MLELERELEKARTKFSMYVKEHVVWAIDAKNMKKLEVNIDEMEKAMS